MSAMKRKTHFSDYFSPKKHKGYPTSEGNQIGTTMTNNNHHSSGYNTFIGEVLAATSNVESRVSGSGTITPSKAPLTHVEDTAAEFDPNTIYHSIEDEMMPSFMEPTPVLRREVGLGISLVSRRTVHTSIQQMFQEQQQLTTMKVKALPTQASSAEVSAAQREKDRKYRKRIAHQKWYQKKKAGKRSQQGLAIERVKVQGHMVLKENMINETIPEATLPPADLQEGQLPTTASRNLPPLATAPPATAPPATASLATAPLATVPRDTPPPTTATKEMLPPITTSKGISLSVTTSGMKVAPGRRMRTVKNLKKRRQKTKIGMFRTSPDPPKIVSSDTDSDDEGERLVRQPISDGSGHRHASPVMKASAKDTRCSLRDKGHSHRDNKAARPKVKSSSKQSVNSSQRRKQTGKRISKRSLSRDQVPGLGHGSKSQTIRESRSSRRELQCVLILVGKGAQTSSDNDSLVERIEPLSRTGVRAWSSGSQESRFRQEGDQSLGISGGGPRDARRGEGKKSGNNCAQILRRSRRLKGTEQEVVGL